MGAIANKNSGSRSLYGPKNDKRGDDNVGSQPVKNLLKVLQSNNSHNHL